MTLESSLVGAYLVGEDATLVNPILSLHRAFAPRRLWLCNMSRHAAPRRHDHGSSSHRRACLGADCTGMERDWTGLDRAMAERCSAVKAALTASPGSASTTAGGINY